MLHGSFLIEIRKELTDYINDCTISEITKTDMKNLIKNYKIVGADVSSKKIELLKIRANELCIDWDNYPQKKVYEIDTDSKELLIHQFDKLLDFDLNNCTRKLNKQDDRHYTISYIRNNKTIIHIIATVKSNKITGFSGSIYG
jgi:hypothetical protein